MKRRGKGGRVGRDGTPVGNHVEMGRRVGGGGRRKRGKGEEEGGGVCAASVARIAIVDGKGMHRQQMPPLQLTPGVF